MLLVENLHLEKRIQGLNASFPARGFFALVGPNGSGKTTLLKCLIYLQKPTRGEIYWNTQPISQKTRLQIKELITFLPSMEIPPLPFTALEIVAMGRYGLPHDPLAIEEALEFTETTPFAKKRVETLSLGERQRVYLARAFAQKTPILLLDEPTSCLDFRFRKKMYNYLEEIKKNHLLIAATHDFELARMADKTLFLEEGRLLFQGPFKLGFDKSLIV